MTRGKGVRGTGLCEHVSENTHSDGSVSYTARYRYKGHYAKHTFPSHREALSWLAAERRLVALDQAGTREWTLPSRRPSTPTIEPDRPHATLAGDMLFTDYADEWLRGYRKRDGEPVRYRTMETMKAGVRALKTAFPPPVRLCDMTPSLIRQWYDDPAPRAVERFRQSCQLLNAMLRDAADPERDGGRLIAANPFRLRIPPRGPVPSHDAPPVNGQQLRALYDAFPPHLRVSVLLATLVGGLRRSELCALRVMDFDLDNRILYIRHSVEYSPEHRHWILCRTKTPRSNRTVPIPRIIIPRLETHFHDYCQGPESFLFPSSTDPSYPACPHTLARWMRIARVTAGRGDLTLQMLRASHATLYMVQGGTLRETMDQLGHVTEDVAIRHYQRIVPEHRRGVVDRLAALMLADLPDDHPPIPHDDDMPPPAPPTVMTPVRNVNDDMTREEVEQALIMMRRRLASLERMLLDNTTITA